MTLGRGRVIRGSEARPLPVPLAASAKAAGQRLPAEVAAAKERARLVLLATEARARALLQTAEQAVAETRLAAEEIGRADGLAQAARVLALLESRYADADDRAVERVVTLARLLAERLVGRALELDGSVVQDLARQVILEARGARRIALFAHPEDAPQLRRAMGDLDPEGRLQSVTEDPALVRGDLRLETDVGAIAARLGPSLERLAVRLAEALRK